MIKERAIGNCTYSERYCCYYAQVYSHSCFCVYQVAPAQATHSQHCVTHLKSKLSVEK